MSEPILEMRHISKFFPGVKANDDVNLKIYAGEIHALLGENGAGKSTLMNVLLGIYKPDAGEILYKGKPVKIRSPRDAVELGIGMVHQHFKLVEPLTVTENVYLGHKDCKAILNMNQMHQRIAACTDEFGLEIDPKARIWQLSIGEQQRVEIVKLLFRGAEVLILDEPTAVLTPQESESLFATLRRMADAGKAVIFISHKMYEVMTYPDRITILRAGHTVDTKLRSETNQEELTGLMVGRQISQIDLGQERQETGGEVMRLDGVCARNDKGLPALNGVDLQLRAGEILGIAGVAGNGQRELAEVITGLRTITSGTLTIDGEDVTRRSVAYIHKKGVAFVPEDRLGMGLVPGMSAVENVMLRDFDTPDSASRGVVQKKKVTERTRRFIDQYDVKLAGMKKPVRLMSGGNQQKLLLARELNSDPKIMVTAYPVRGLDVGATYAVHEILVDLRKKGVGVLLISEDLEELFEMSDRIAVLFEGHVTGVMERRDFDFYLAGRLMSGAAELGEEDGRG